MLPIGPKSTFDPFLVGNIAMEKFCAEYYTWRHQSDLHLPEGGPLRDAALEGPPMQLLVQRLRRTRVDGRIAQDRKSSALAPLSLARLEN
eukprot:5223980-Amphidinium_carterae.1